MFGISSSCDSKLSGWPLTTCVYDYLFIYYLL